MPSRPLIRLSDVARLVQQAGGWMAAGVTPTRSDAEAIQSIEKIWATTKRGEREALVSRIVAATPAWSNREQVDRLTVEWYARRAELNWGRLRASHRTDWAAEVELDGAERLRRARDQGRGAVLWFLSTCSSFVLMRGLASSGESLTHLSLATHGSPGGTRFGELTVARFHRMAEDRYLERRIVIDDVRAPGYVREVRNCLAENGLLTVRGDLAIKGAGVRVPLLGGAARFPAGAPTFAFHSGAALLPCWAERVAPFRYRVVVEEPLESPGGASRREFAVAAMERFSALLERRLGESPADWEGWWWADRLLGGKDFLQVRR
ncbi:MAG: hypothetical protein O2795_20490 [Acidobacteria bacterium]|nr:hypothetical protein [Acidobacteriota bacterium]